MIVSYRMISCVTQSQKAHRGTPAPLSTYTVHTTIAGVLNGRRKAALADLVTDLLRVELEDNVGGANRGGLDVATSRGARQSLNGGALEVRNAAEHWGKSGGEPSCRTEGSR